MKQPLPAKYAKMTVCTFWVLKQLKSIGILDEEKMGEISEHFHLFQDSEDQMLFFKDLVENFKEHENYLKMYASAKNLKKEDDEEEQPTQIAEKVATKKVVSETEKSVKKKELTEAELIQQLLLRSNQLKEKKEEVVVPPVVPEITLSQKPKIKLIIKK